MSGKTMNVYTLSRWAAIRLVLVVYDILAINIAFYLALLIRFYVGAEFHYVAASYLSAYRQFAPYYTFICLAIFAVFKLYSGVWKYAGLNDLNRITLANIICVAVHVFGTLVFVMRMPITYYIIGGGLQLLFIVASRFSYRILVVETRSVNGIRRKASVNVMVVGSGENTRTVIKQLFAESIARPVCVVNSKAAAFASYIDGVPVISDISSIPNAIKRYHVGLVIIADRLMPKGILAEIEKACEAEKIEIQNYSGYFQTDAGRMTLKTVAEYSASPVEIVANGNTQRFADAEQAMLAYPDDYVVQSIAAKDSALVIVLNKHTVVLNDLNERWVQEQEAGTGEDISFF